MDNTEALSMMLKGMDFDAEDLIRVVSALGEIKKKKIKIFKVFLRSLLGGRLTIKRELTF